ncbi:hypothetical protein [Sphingorhabdus sp.]|uniref:hypothetical protein n=1 Tax=Sphingorhabdus sp. TaxID=1902408 RepID=UPI00333F7AA1
MRRLALTFSGAAALLAAPVSAQDSTQPNEYKLGPINVKQEVQGVRVEMLVNLYLNIVSAPSGITFRNRAYADLSDIQAKFNTLIRKVPVPRDNCASYSQTNIIAEINRGRLEASGSDAVAIIDGRAEVWSCVENIFQDVTIKWKVKRIGFFKTKVPVRMTVTRSRPIKTRLLSQSFTAKIPIRITNTGSELGAEVRGLDIDLNGQYAGLLRAALFFGGLNLESTAQNMLNKSIRPNVIPLLVPEDFKIFNPKVQTVRFIEDGSRLKLEAILSGSLDAGAVPTQIQDLAEGGS